MNDSFANEERLAKEMGQAYVALHPADAATLGLQDGDQARVSNETGELVLQVRISDQTSPGVALSMKGRWPKLEETKANVNILNPGTKTDMGESSAVHGVEVLVTPL